MPRYYFHMRAGGDYLRDEEGAELPDRPAAYATALKGARAIMGADLLDGRIDLSNTIEVDDARGGSVLVLAFRDAVAIEG